MSKNVKTHSNKMINTPRTDAEEANQTQRYCCRMVKSDFARQLELELADQKQILAEWRTLCLWGGTPEIVHSFIKAQQERIYACQLVEDELAEVQAANTAMTEAFVRLSNQHRRTLEWEAQDQRQRMELAEAKKDTARIDWLADRTNSIGIVSLPEKYVLNNMHCMRAAIDAAMAEPK